VVAETNEAMRVLKIIFRLVRLGLIWLLAAYWVIFAGYTIRNLLTGGTRAVVAWYVHISSGNGLPFQWGWRGFLAQQLAVFAITLALWFVGRANSRFCDFRPPSLNLAIFRIV
jgi:hypothetical protein